MEQREREILARLEHPNIARLLDAGIDTLTYYRALKWARDSGRYDDLDAALAAGREATELVRESRQYLDGLVASAAVVA